MNLQKDLPRLNYAVITGVIKRRKGINLTRSGIPVLHLLVENTVEPYNDGGEPTVSEIQVDAWGRLASALDGKLSEGDAVLVEGRLSHNKKEDIAGGEHFQTVLKASRIEFFVNMKERKE
jgi:single-stranded DNA-binding protein